MKVLPSYSVSHHQRGGVDFFDVTLARLTVGVKEQVTGSKKSGAGGQGQEIKMVLKGKI